VLDVLSRDEIDKLEGVARFERDKVIVRLLADTGIRANELIGVRQVDLVERGRDRFIRVHGKGAKDRLPSLRRSIAAYIEFHVVAQRMREVTGCFSRRGRRPGGGYEQLTVSGLDQLIRGLGERAGLEKRIYPHLLRHSFATEMLNRRMDAITLSRILGHSSLA
jgi:integrase/recombinase XerD